MQSCNFNPKAFTVFSHLGTLKQAWPQASHQLKPSVDTITNGNGYRRVAWPGPYGLPINRKRLSAMTLCLIHIPHTNKQAIRLSR